MITGLKILLRIRNNLLYLRKRVNRKSLDELATDIKISKDTLYKLENNGDTEKPLYPNLKTLITISEYFNVELGDFISKDIEMENVKRLEVIDRIERLGDLDHSNNLSESVV